MEAVIMAAGLGNRLRPLTDRLPKPMMPVAGRPVIEHIVRLLVRHGLTNLGIKLHYRWDLIAGHLRDGSNLGANLLYRVEGDLLGTAFGVRQFSSQLRETFCVIASDIVTDINISELLRRHRAAGALASIGLTPVEDVSRYGVAALGEDGRIVTFQEKPAPQDALSNLVSTGIYILEPEVLDYVEQDPNYDFGRDLFPKLSRIGAPVYGFPVSGYWNDIGTLRDYLEASVAIADDKVHLNRLQNGVRYGPSTLIQQGMVDPDVYLEECVVWPGVNVRGSGMLRRCIVTQSCTLTGQSIENSVYVGGDRPWVTL